MVGAVAGVHHEPLAKLQEHIPDKGGRHLKDRNMISASVQPTKRL